MRRSRPIQLIVVVMALLIASCADGNSDPPLETASIPTPTATPSPTAASPTPTETSPTTTTPTTTQPTTTVTPEPEATPGRRTYTVAPGDSLAAIAQTHDVSLQDLAAANALANPNQISAGQELTIPAPGETFDPPPPPPAETPAEAGGAAPPPPADPAPPQPLPPPPPPPAPAGGDIYFNHCSGCHGGSGEGASGPALGGGAVVAKYPNAANQIAVVTNGQGGMPAYGGIISPAEIEAVVYFTRSL